MNAREYALNALERVVVRHGYANLILRAQPEKFSPADTALISELVYGTLRNERFLHYQWEPFARRSVRPRTALLLDMSVYQLQNLNRIPAYAVLDQAAQLAGEGEKGFVNALLRKVQAQGIRQPQESDPLKAAAIRTSHPDWIMQLWQAHYGQAAAIQIAQHDQQPAVVYGRINTLKISRDQLAQQPGIHFVDEDAFTYDGILSQTKWFHNGQVLIQDRAAQQIPRLMELQDGLKVLDCCAAPGTKTQEIAMLMHNKGQILATDLYEARTQLVADLMKRTGVSIVQTLCRDASRRDASLAEQSFARILVDAPCSGLGDLSHKPEIRMHVQPTDLDELIQTQRKILRATAPLLQIGGLMVYSTCTLNKKENEYQIRDFLQDNPGCQLKSEKTWFPDELNSDGFYAAQIVRIS